MNSGKPEIYYCSIVQELRKLPTETEWVEFKHNKVDAEEIGQYLSALSNSAALVGKVKAYLIWGIEDGSHEIIGTTFKPREAKVENEELENWLLRLLSPKIKFNFYELIMEDKPVVLLEIGSAFRHPVQFKNIEYIRVGSYLKKLKDFSEIERELWRIFDETPFERGIAQDNISAEDVLLLIDYPAYFSLLNMPLPDSRDGIMKALESEEMFLLGVNGQWNITNLGAILFAKDISQFSSLKRKAIRVIQYKGENRIETVREQTGSKGYACGFERLIEFLNTVLPSNEVIGKALRKDVPMFPDIAIRELVANALIHQDFYLTGTAPMIEIFSDRIEITNPGSPLVKTDRFLDSPPKSRNEALASFMRRIGVCEERGSGVDKVIFQTEFYQLPAPLFEETDEHTRSVLFAHKDFKDMGKEDRVRACYLHACLQYVQRKNMTNRSLRERFGIEESKGAQVTRVINATIEGGLIKKIGVLESRKDAKYVPYWS